MRRSVYGILVTIEKKPLLENTFFSHFTPALVRPNGFERAAFFALTSSTT